jgi:hypothetical protein
MSTFGNPMGANQMAMQVAKIEEKESLSFQASPGSTIQALRVSVQGPEAATVEVMAVSSTQVGLSVGRAVSDSPPREKEEDEAARVYPVVICGRCEVWAKGRSAEEKRFLEDHANCTTWWQFGEKMEVAPAVLGLFFVPPGYKYAYAPLEELGFEGRND